MEETFKTKDGSMLLTEQGITIFYNKITRLLLVFLYVVYINACFSEYFKYTKTGSDENLIILVLLLFFFAVLGFYTISLLRNRFVSYSSIQKVVVRSEKILIRVTISFVLNNGQRKKVYIDYNENTIGSIENLMKKKGIEVVVKL